LVRLRRERASAPADAFLAADAGTLAPLGREDVGVAGVGVAPAQVAMQGPGHAERGSRAKSFATDSPM
jgi:hypothetical protein